MGANEALAARLFGVYRSALDMPTGLLLEWRELSGDTRNAWREVAAAKSSADSASASPMACREDD